MEARDLDILRPKPSMVRFHGFEVDVSFIPVALTFEVDRIMTEMSELGKNQSAEDLAMSKEAVKRSTELSADLISVVCWVLNNLSASQIMAFTEEITRAMVRSYEGLPKDPQAAAEGSQ
jgi:hypothetical protein